MLSTFRHHFFFVQTLLTFQSSAPNSRWTGYIDKNLDGKRRDRGQVCVQSTKHSSIISIQINLFQQQARACCRCSIVYQSITISYRVNFFSPSPTCFLPQFRSGMLLCRLPLLDAQKSPIPPTTFSAEIIQSNIKKGTRMLIARSNPYQSWITTCS